MATQDLIKLIAGLSEQQQKAVEEFVRYIQTRQAESAADVAGALDTFIREHEELLTHLAQ